IGIAHDDDASGGIMPEKPGNIGDRDANRFERPRWLIDDKSHHLTDADPPKFMDDCIDVPVCEIRCARQNSVERLLNEKAQLRTQQCGENSGIVHFFLDRLRSIGSSARDRSGVAGAGVSEVPASSALKASRIARSSEENSWLAANSGISLLKRTPRSRSRSSARLSPFKACSRNSMRAPF